MTDGARGVDMAAIIAAHPAETIELPTAAVLASGLGLGEMLDVAEVTGTHWKALGAKVAERDRDGQPTLLAMRIMLAIAWVLRRRGAPGVTWADAQRWQVRPPPAELPPDPPPPARDGQETIS
jgi:hypothetical protein